MGLDNSIEYAISNVLKNPILQNSQYNWRKLLILSASAFIEKIKPLQRYCDDRVLIIDDTIELINLTEGLVSFCI